jgi:hypothetical protein
VFALPSCLLLVPHAFFFVDARSLVSSQTQVQLFQLDREVYMATFGQFETRGATSPSRPGAGAGGEEEHKSSGAASSGVAAHIKSEPRARLGIPFRELEQRATLGTGTFGRVRCRRACVHRRRLLFCCHCCCWCSHSVVGVVAVAVTGRAMTPASVSCVSLPARRRR